MSGSGRWRSSLSCETGAITGSYRFNSTQVFWRRSLSVHVEPPINHKPIALKSKLMAAPGGYRRQMSKLYWEGLFPLSYHCSIALEGKAVVSSGRNSDDFLQTKRRIGLAAAVVSP